jgi:hypothetical protein
MRNIETIEKRALTGPRFISKQPPRPGLVPESGDPEHPYRWIRPKDDDISPKLTPEQEQEEFEQKFPHGSNTIDNDAHQEFLDYVRDKGVDEARLSVFLANINSWLSNEANAMRRIEMIMAEPIGEVLYEFTQEKMKEKHPGGYVTLYRGVYGEIAAEIWESAQSSKEIQLKSHELSSWTPNKVFARNISRSGAWQGGDKSAVVKIDVPITQVALTWDAWRHQPTYAGEEEYLVSNASHGIGEIVEGWANTKPSNAPSFRG